MIRISGIFWVLFLLPWGALAQWTLGVETKLEAVHFAEDLGDDVAKDHLRLEIKPQAERALTEQSNIYVAPEFVADPLNPSEVEQYYFDSKETYFRVLGETWTLKAGSNLVNWGVSDGYNPLDVVNSRQYFDPLRARKKGELSLVFSQAFEHVDYELIYIPRKTGSVLPGPQSRWLPREIYVPYTPENDVVLKLPPSLRFSFQDQEDLDQAREQNFGARLQFHGPGLDVGFSGFEGAANFPLIQPEVTGVITAISPKTEVEVDPDVLLRQQFYRIRQVGGTFVRQQGQTLLKYATSYTESLGGDPDLPGWLHESVIALERTFAIGSKASLIALVQYSFIDSEIRNDSNLSVTEIFRNAWMAGGRLSIAETWTVSALGLYQNASASSYAELSLSRRYLDVWNASVIANSINGPEDSVLGVYKNNDSIQVSLGRAF